MNICRNRGWKTEKVAIGFCPGEIRMDMPYRRGALETIRCFQPEMGLAVVESRSGNPEKPNPGKARSWGATKCPSFPAFRSSWLPASFFGRMTHVPSPETNNRKPQRARLPFLTPRLDSGRTPETGTQNPSTRLASEDQLSGCSMILTRVLYMSAVGPSREMTGISLQSRKFFSVVSIGPCSSAVSALEMP
ncbi:hypothetical protein SCOR_33990 [Sulfidibacter corallicola]